MSTSVPTFRFHAGEDEIEQIYPEIEEETVEKENPSPSKNGTFVPLNDYNSLLFSLILPHLPMAYSCLNAVCSRHTVSLTTNCAAPKPKAWASSP